MYNFQICLNILITYYFFIKIDYCDKTIKSHDFSLVIIYRSSLRQICKVLKLLYRGTSFFYASKRNKEMRIIMYFIKDSFSFSFASLVNTEYEVVAVFIFANRVDEIKHRLSRTLEQKYRAHMRRREGNVMDLG